MNLFEKIRRKRLSASEQVRLMFRDSFEDAAKSKSIRSRLTGDPMSDGMIIYSSISLNYKCIKESKDFQTVRSLTIIRDGFDPEEILDEELELALKKYCGMASPIGSASRPRAESRDYSRTPSDMDIIKQKLADKVGVSVDAVEKKIEELNLAPDISHENNLENKLFRIASQGARMIESKFKRFPNGGYAEALIYCSSILVDLGTSHQNTLDMDVFEDRYFLLLGDEIMINSEVDDPIKYINSRVGFYNGEERKLNTESNYSTMFIYNAFYMNPGCDNPRNLASFSESPMTLIRLHQVLKEVKVEMERQCSRLGYKLPTTIDILGDLLDDLPF